MKASIYTKGYKEALEKGRIMSVANVALSILCLLLGLLAFKQRERVVIVPPVIEDRMVVAYDSANANYYQSWALFVATFLGNINPGNSEFVAEGLKMSFTPELYIQMKQEILQQADNLRLSGRALRFFADRVVYEPETAKTFVTGKQEIVSSSGAVREQEVVYEMVVKIKHGLPMVAQFEYYPGAPKTLEWLAKHGGADRS